jgi:hypothetical protein
MIYRFAAAAAVCLSLVLPVTAREWKSGIVWPEPKVVQAPPESKPPSDAIVLFDGKDLSKWSGGKNWEVKEGYCVPKRGEITTKQGFGDCQIHIEWASPLKVRGSGQGRGNSGIYIMGKYEIQILDSYDNKTYFDGQAGALYKTRPPMVNASRKPGAWQAYDILFTAPRFGKDGKLSRHGFITVLHNGVVIHNHTKVLGATKWTAPPSYAKHAEKLPFHLQNHGNPVRFRNIWVRQLTPVVGTKPDGTKVGGWD